MLVVAADEALAYELADFLREERFDARVHLHGGGAALPEWAFDAVLVDFASHALDASADAVVRELRRRCRSHRVFGLSLDRADRNRADETFSAPFDLDALVNRLRAAAGVRKEDA